MDLKFEELLSDQGGFADIWRATDQLGRELAVKIVRESSVGISNALQHARALARAKHQNVVVVHAVEKVNDPKGQGEVDAVVMELLPGETVGERLKGVPFTLDELAKIGRGVVAAIQFIHRNGMVHGDLHEENVMISQGEAKIIDLLHRYTLATASVTRRDEQIAREVRQLKQLLLSLVSHSELDSLHSLAFTDDIKGALTVADLHRALESAISTAPPTRLRLEHARTPLNLLDLVGPGMHREKVRSLLGAPSYVEGDRWLYRYQETQVEIAFDAREAVIAAVIALCIGKKYFGTHPTAHTDQPLGELTLADVLEHYNDVKDVELFDSMRTREVYVRGRWGPSGAWTYYACGALNVLSGVGHLAPTTFEWDEVEKRLISDPKDVLINWMAVMANYSDDVQSFNWFIKA